MKTYIITSNLDRYTNNYFVVKGKSFEDPELIKKVLEWLCSFNDGDYDFSSWIEGMQIKPQTLSNYYGIKAYEISDGPMLVPDIWKKLDEHIAQTEEKYKKNREAQDKELRKIEYEKLKEEFEEEFENETKTHDQMYAEDLIKLNQNK